MNVKIVIMKTAISLILFFAVVLSGGNEGEKKYTTKCTITITAKNTPALESTEQTKTEDKGATTNEHAEKESQQESNIKGRILPTYGPDGKIIPDTGDTTSNNSQSQPNTGDVKGKDQIVSETTNKVETSSTEPTNNGGKIETQAQGKTEEVKPESKNVSVQTNEAEIKTIESSKNVGEVESKIEGADGEKKGETVEEKKEETQVEAGEYSVTFDCHDDQEQKKVIKHTYECKGKQLLIYQFIKETPKSKEESPKKEETPNKRRMLYHKKQDVHKIWINKNLPFTEVIDEQLENYKLHEIEQHEKECDFLIHWTSIAKVASLILTLISF